MAKKKEEKEEKKEKIVFDIEQEFSKINPLLVEGLQKYIFENQLVIKTKKEFDDLLEHYGGF